MKLFAVFAALMTILAAVIKRKSAFLADKTFNNAELAFAFKADSAF
jgi:hypothetical protein